MQSNETPKSDEAQFKITSSAVKTPAQLCEHIYSRLLICYEDKNWAYRRHKHFGDISSPFQDLPTVLKLLFMTTLVWDKYSISYHFLFSPSKVLSLLRMQADLVDRQNSHMWIPKVISFLFLLPLHHLFCLSGPVCWGVPQSCCGACLGGMLHDEGLIWSKTSHCHFQPK